MAKDTDIEWCDSTVNPTMGCDGCELWNEQAGVKTCYAGTLHDRYGGSNSGFSPRFNVLTKYPGRMEKAANWPDLTGKPRPEKPWLNNLPRHIFVSDMSDALSRDIDFPYLKEQIIDVAASDRGRRHRWMWLTKQARRMRHFREWLAENNIQWPANLWPGTSVTSQATMARVREMQMMGVDFFVSAEPLFEAVDFSRAFAASVVPSLVIVGGASGDGAAPFNVDWARSIIGQCKAAGMACFVKQLGGNVEWSGTQGGYGDGPSNVWPKPNVSTEVSGGFRIRLKDSKGGDMAEWPEDLRIREMPKVGAVAG